MCQITPIRLNFLSWRRRRRTTRSTRYKHWSRIWQDVYHYPTLNYDLYIKLQIVKDVVIVSFKER
ncbi:MAG: type II toxin-antitoxin system MqsR family toxin [Candidatus Obscuribacter sp.]|nr:type II toxin-antitoxin system MqsR family toxin [Candidatus Obscuribacter sp.]